MESFCIIYLLCNWDARPLHRAHRQSPIGIQYFSKYFAQILMQMLHQSEEKEMEVSLQFRTLLECFRRPEIQLFSPEYYQLSISNWPPSDRE